MANSKVDHLDPPIKVSTVDSAQKSHEVITMINDTPKIYKLMVLLIFKGRDNDLIGVGSMG